MSTQQDPMFNPEAFLQTTIDTELSTEALQVPPGEYDAVSSGISADSFKSFKIGKGERAGQFFRRLDVEWNINDPDGKLKEYLGRDPKVRQQIPLDIRPDGGLETGKGRNVALGQLREALGQNQSGRPWSFSSLGGQPAKITIAHRIDGDRTYVDVKAVAKAA